MTTRTRSLFMASAAVATSLTLAVGSVVAQDDADGMDGAEPMDGGISVSSPWTRESRMLDLAGAAYMVITNSTDEADSLIGASSPAAAVIEIHETSMDEDGAMAMAMVGEIPLGAQSETVLEPGGYHIMLIDLVEPLVEGAEIELSLEFATAAPQTITVPVTGPMGPEGMEMAEMDHSHMDHGDDDHGEKDHDEHEHDHGDHEHDDDEHDHDDHDHDHDDMEEDEG